MHTPNPGINLRDYFAAQALVGLLAGRMQGSMFTSKEAAANAYALADAMLEQRKP